VFTYVATYHIREYIQNDGSKTFYFWFVNNSIFSTWYNLHYLHVCHVATS